MLSACDSEMAAPAGSAHPVGCGGHENGPGTALYESVPEAGQGMVAKHRKSTYRGGLTGDWLKVKCLRTHEFVVGGWIPAPGSSRRIRALLLGEFMDGALHYVGKVDTGFDAKTPRDIGDALEIRTDPPFMERVPDLMPSSARIPGCCAARSSAGLRCFESLEMAAATACPATC